MNKQSDSFSNIVHAYEQNIGLLTNTITDKLLIASKIYSHTWIREAILDARDKDRKNWTYIQKYLELRKYKNTPLNRKEEGSNAKSQRISYESNKANDPYKSVIKRSWKK